MAKFEVTLNVYRAASSTQEIEAENADQAKKQIEKLWAYGKLDNDLSEMETTGHKVEIQSNSKDPNYPACIAGGPLCSNEYCRCRQ